MRKDRGWVLTLGCWEVSWMTQTSTHWGSCPPKWRNFRPWCISDSHWMQVNNHSLFPLDLEPPEQGSCKSRDWLTLLHLQAGPCPLRGSPEGPPHSLRWCWCESQRRLGEGVPHHTQISKRAITARSGRADKLSRARVAMEFVRHRTRRGWLRRGDPGCPSSILFLPKVHK